MIQGPLIPMMKIVRGTGIEKMLKKHLADMESMEIIAIAASNNVRPLPLSSIDTWFGGTSLSRTMDVDMKSQPTSDLLDRKGKTNLYRQFPRDVISRINPGTSLLNDITSRPSYVSAVILEYGHAKNYPDLE